MERYLFTFPHMAGLKTFGPYETEEEAKMHFQMRYGYWPLPASKIEVWES